MPAAPLPLGVPRLHPGSSYVVVTGTNPAAGIEVSQTVPAGEAWLLLAVTVSCVQGITQTPWPALTLDDGTTKWFQGLSGTAAQNASITTQHTWAPGLTAVGSGASTANQGALPAGVILPSGSRIQTVTTGIGANTDYGVPAFYVLKFT